MQQATNNIRYDNSVTYPELYKVPSNSSEENNGTSLGFSDEKQPRLVTSLNDWEFFCNELEYE